MKNIITFKRLLLKKVLLVLGVCTAGLMAACAKYGTFSGALFIEVKGTVRSKITNLVIEGIQVELNRDNSEAKDLTDSGGEFTIDTDIHEDDNIINLHISDIDGALNGNFAAKDTAITLTAAEKEAGLKENIVIKLKKNE
jgi:putative lipoprotein (rSAM/lipoprotein system)